MLGLVRANVHVVEGGLGERRVPGEDLSTVDVAPVPVGVHDGGYETRVCGRGKANLGGGRELGGGDDVGDRGCEDGAREGEQKER